MMDEPDNMVAISVSWPGASTKKIGESATVQINGDSGGSSCAGEYNVFEDNVYGTFMVNPVPDF